VGDSLLFRQVTNTRIKPTKISEVATVPLSQIPVMFKRLKEIREKHKVW
jgi:glycolate oxidase